MARRRRPGKLAQEGQRAVAERKRISRSWVPVPLADSVEDGGTVTVMAPKFQGRLGKGMVSLARVPQTYRLNLDEFGSAVWRLIDGRRCVGDIADALVERFGEDVEPALPRLLSFLRSLRNTGAIEVTTRENAEVAFK